MTNEVIEKILIDGNISMTDSILLQNCAMLNLSNYNEVNQMELMDWKSIEQSAEDTIRNSATQVELANIMLSHAIINIKKLNGKTNEEIREEAKANHS